MDAWACRSQQRAVAGIDRGAFNAEIAPLEVNGPEGPVLFAIDEHPRRSTMLEGLALLPPLHPEIEGFSITAGNAAGLNDAAAAMVIADRNLVDAEGLEPLAVVRTWASAGVAPERTGLAPTVAVPKALEGAGLSIGDIDLWEINEAFASMCVATCKVLDRRTGQRARQRLQPRPPHRHDRGPDGDDADPRAAPPRRRRRGRRDVCRRRDVDRRRARSPRPNQLTPGLLGAAFHVRGEVPIGMSPSQGPAVLRPDEQELSRCSG